MESAKEKTDKYVAQSYLRSDVTFTRGEGSFLFDENGKKYIDFGTGIAVNGLGYGFKPWRDAVVAQVDKLAHASNLYYTEPMAFLAEKLCLRTGLKRVFFGNSGAEANECAIKTARKYASDKGKNTTIAALKNSFHGRTLTTLSATGQEAFHKYFTPFTEGFVFAEANNFEDFKEKAEKNEICAVMFELVQGEGGVIALDKEYVGKMCEYAKNNDILVIIDEVQTGNGRTGTLYAYEQYGIVPDIVTTAKGLGNGLPIGACMFGEKTENVLTPGTHGSTFGGNPVVCAGACAVIDAVDGKLLRGVKEKAEKIRNALEKCKKIKSVTGLGLMIGIETDDAGRVKNECLKRGLVVLTAHDRIRLLPPLNIDGKTLDQGLKILTEVLG
jgi:acetylornithine/N-succinyldiaminopimelate aminotransferase